MKGWQPQASDTETLDRLYLEWSQFTRALTWRDLITMEALSDIANSHERTWVEPGEHANWCAERAQKALALLSSGERT